MFKRQGEGVTLPVNVGGGWVLSEAGAKEKVDLIDRECGLTRDEKLVLIGEVNVKLQIKHLNSFALVRELRRRGKAPYVHGRMHSVETGAIRVLVEGPRLISPS